MGEKLMRSMWISCLRAAGSLAVCGIIVVPSTTSAQGLLQLMVPDAPQTTTTQAVVHIAARAHATQATTATIGGVEVPIFGTGVFARDSVLLQPGSNEITIEVPGEAAPALRQTITVVRAPEPEHPAPAPSLPLFIESDTIEPKENLALVPGEHLEVTFKGAPANQAEFRAVGTEWLPMEEELDTEGRASGRYRAAYTIAPSDAEAADDATSGPILFRLTAKTPPAGQDQEAEPATLLTESKGRVAVWLRAGLPRLVRVKDTQVGQVSFGLTEVRLGGPFLAELTSGTVLRVVGRQGYNLKVELCPGQQAWIPAYQVEPAAPGTPLPWLAFNNINVTTTLEGHELISIPYDSPVPFAIRDVPGDGPGSFPRIEIDFYGAHVAATWLSHRVEPRLVKQVSMEQIQTGQVRLTARLATPRLWGYKTEVGGGALRLIVRKPPPIDPDGSSVLSGLTIAVEAGHGGGNNAGARGMVGSQEKDVTLVVSRLLEKELTAAGARVVQTRVGDESVGLSRRAERAMEADAHMFISIHCNSAGRTRGILAVRGTSTLYKHPFNHELSADIYERIIERTGLDRFGVIGNFNYAPTRILTWMPAVLVEQAFISNPEEEALLINPKFQQTMAEAIRQGMEDYLRRN